MAETFGGIDFEANNDHINYSGLPDLNARVDILGSAYRDGDFALVHGKVSAPFTATYQAFTDLVGSPLDTAKTKYTNILALQGTISTLTTWQGDYTNVLLENVGIPTYTKVIKGGSAVDMAMIPLSFRKMT